MLKLMFWPAIFIFGIVCTDMLQISWPRCRPHVYLYYRSVVCCDTHISWSLHVVLAHHYYVTRLPQWQRTADLESDHIRDDKPRRGRLRLKSAWTPSVVKVAETHATKPGKFEDFTSKQKHNNFFKLRTLNRKCVGTVGLFREKG